ncbi:hypothetical protein HML84_03855 [Alcanivorax sp. IO_7]|nr:hypothetical protein HML84_03855 [Alcanivorax sp. IO_7]
MPETARFQAWLAQLTLDQLDLEPRLRERLQAPGFRTLGSFIRCPAQPWASASARPSWTGCSGCWAKNRTRAAPWRRPGRFAGAATSTTRWTTWTTCTGPWKPCSASWPRTWSGTRKAWRRSAGICT